MSFFNEDLGDLAGEGGGIFFFKGSECFEIGAEKAGDRIEEFYLCLV